jgi:hypothetical protein
MTTTKEERAEWLRLDAEATPGPWAFATSNDSFTIEDGSETERGHPRYHAEAHKASDAAIIASYRAAVPRLVEDVERLERQLAAIRELYAAWNNDDETARPLGSAKAMYLIGEALRGER